MTPAGFWCPAYGTRQTGGAITISIRSILATIRDSIAALYAEGARRGYELADTVVTLNIIDQFSEGHPGSYVTALETRILPA